MALADDPDALRALVEELGGSPIPGPSFKFSMPTADATKIVEELGRWNIRVEKVGNERQEADPRTGDMRSMITCRCLRAPEQNPHRLRGSFGG